MTCNTRLSIILFASLTVGLANGQVPNLDHYLPSPNMASLGEYGSVPVSLFTGTHSVSVPLYTLQSRGHSLPVSLSYHGGGVKVDQHPGWTGLGWTLLAGGSVTRVVNDLPDESNYYNKETDYVRKFSLSEKMGVFYNRDYQSLYNSFTPFSYVAYLPTEPNFDILPASEADIIRRRHCRYDTEPDMFRFELPGLSGYFYFNGSGVLSDGGYWRVVCDRPVKVIFDINDKGNFSRPFAQISGDEEFMSVRSESINNFRLVDEYGTVYTFGSLDASDHSAVEYSIGFFSQKSEEIAAVAWHLTSVRYTDGTEIKLKYEKKDYIAQFSVNENYTRQYFNHEYKYNRYNGQPLTDGLGAMSIMPFYGFAQGSLLVPSYLKEIEMGQTRLEFETEESHELRYDPELYYDMHHKGYEKASKSDMAYLQCATVHETNANYIEFEGLSQLRWHKLRRILVKDTAGTLLKSYNFSYNDDDPARKGKERLALLSLTETSPGTDKGGSRHTFEYDRLNLLPPYCTYDVDHWGFYSKTGIARIDTADNGDRYFTRLIMPYDIRNDNSGSDTGTADELVPIDTTIFLDPLIRPKRVSTDRTVDNRTQYEKARDASPSVATIGALLRINYPTGGYTRFEYENHDYRASVDTLRTRLVEHNKPQIAGGLRLKAIYRSDDGVNESLYRTYRYSDPFDTLRSQSSGILMNPRHYYVKLVNTNVSADYLYMKNVVTNVFNTQSVYPVSADGDGAEVGYSAVSEIFPDGSMTVHRFTNHDDGHGDEMLDEFSQGGLSVYFPYVSKAMERGLLKQQVHYDTLGVPVQSDSTVYESDDLDWRAVSGGRPAALYMARIFNHCVTVEIPYSVFHIKDMNIKEVFPRRIYTYRMRPVSHTITEYADGMPVALTRQTTTYTDSYGLPRKTVTTYPDNSRDETETRYLFDDCDLDTSGVAEAHTQAYALNHPTLLSLVSYSYRGVKTDMQRTIMKYSSDNFSSPTSFVVKKGLTTPSDSITFTYISGDRPVCEANEITGLRTVYVWGYGGEHVVATIANADVATVERHIGSLENFSKTADPDFSALIRMSRNLAATSPVTIYKYQPGVGVSEMILPDFTHIYYHYDGFGRLAYTTDTDGNVIEVYDYHYSEPANPITP